MVYEKIEGVPKFSCDEYSRKTKDYVALIPIINEGDRIIRKGLKKIIFLIMWILLYVMADRQMVVQMKKD